jgi:plastocyanin
MRVLIGAVILFLIFIGIVSFFSVNRGPTGQIISNITDGPFAPQKDLPFPYEESGEVVEDIDAEYKIRIVNYAYSPIAITIKQGQTVVWENRDYVKHTITSIGSGPLDSDELKRGEMYAYTFNSPGLYEYYCKLHPYMRGKIRVE